MQALDRKLLRDVWRIKMQVAAIGLVVAAGVALFVAMFATFRSLRVSELQYYTDASRTCGPSSPARRVR